MRRHAKLALAVLGLLLVVTAPAGLPAGRAGAAEPEVYRKNCRGVRPTLPIGTTQGTEGDDVIVGTGYDDVIYGNGGNDLICGGEGNDTIYGGRGEDYLVGNDGDDVLYGGPGRDTLAGMFGCDRLYGGNGNDLLRPGEGGSTHGGSPECVGFVDGGASADHVLVTTDGRNEYWGGAGLDLLDFHPMMGNLTIDLGAGTVEGHLGAGAISATAVDFERARGTWGADSIIGTDGPNRLVGMHGGDTLWGRGGDDFLNGGPDLAGDGADTLHGEDGFDTCVNGESTTDCEA